MRTKKGFKVGFGRLLVALASVPGLGAAGCDEGHDGDRCVLALSHNDCASSDLTCMQPTDCPETYCCSANSMNPYCQAGCNGGALSILFASCSTTTPSALCPCINVINGINLGPLPPDQYPPGVDCSCVSVGDPIACLAAAADAGMADAGMADTSMADTSMADTGMADTSVDAGVEDAGDATLDTGASVPDAADASGE
jgi:hypothetical protein